MKSISIPSIILLSLILIARADDAQLLRSGFQQLLHTGIVPRYLKDVSKHHQIDISFFEQPSIGNLSTSVSCNGCDEFVNTVIALVKVKTPKFIVKGLIEQVCSLLHFEDKRVCSGLLNPMLDVLFFIMENGKNVTGGKFCSLLLGTTCHNQFDYFNWTIDVPSKPSTIPKKIISGDSSIRILQLTDIHVDPRYTPGSKAVCDETLCCQDDQGIPENPQEACGVWGDYRNADTPMKLLEETLRHAGTQDFDYVYFTGDIVHHRVWDTSKEANSKLEQEIMDLLGASFEVPVLFVLGNHEPHPLNLYAPMSINKTNLSTKWLCDILKKEELGELSDNANLDTIEQGGFYTVLLRPGFRVIVLNNNVCYLNNYWLAYEDYDPYGQLAWLVKVLEKSENDGEFVHLLYHIPTGDPTCLGTWGREFNKIINRFSDTIRAQFNGHTHLDEFFIYYNNSNPTEAIQVAFNGASLATFIGNNPSYKIYDVNGSNYMVEDFEEWTFNLTDANLYPEKPTIDWHKLYSFKETYGLSSMSPSEVGQLVDRMAQNKTLSEIYNKISYRMGSAAEDVCDDDCHKKNLCKIVTSGLDDTFHCERIKQIYDDSKEE